MKYLFRTLLICVMLSAISMAAEADVLVTGRASDALQAKEYITADTQVVVMEKSAEASKVKVNEMLKQIGAPQALFGKYIPEKKYTTDNLKKSWYKGKSGYTWLITRLHKAQETQVYWYVNPEDRDLCDCVAEVLGRACADANNPDVRGIEGTVQEGIAVNKLTNIATGKSVDVKPTDWQTDAHSLFGDAIVPEIVDRPELNAKGFLNDGNFVYKDPEAGIWYYVDHQLEVTITKHQVSGARNLIWYEADIRRSEDSDEHLHCEVSSTKKAENPDKMAQGWVISFNTDYHQFRSDRGLVIRDKTVKNDKRLGKEYSATIPNLDLLVLTEDGGFKTFGASMLTAEQAIDMNACDVLCFGPTYIREGKWRQILAQYHASTEPRMAIGQLEENHYLVIFGNGRLKASSGFTLDEMQKLFLLRGATQAFNLDGGGTSCLFFMGEQIAMVGSNYTNAVRKPRSQWELLTIGQMNQ